MTYGRLVEELAAQLKLSKPETRRCVEHIFASIRKQVLGLGARIVIPKFGTFRLGETKRGVRPLGKYGSLDVPASKHVRFRSAKGAKARAQ